MYSTQQIATHGIYLPKHVGAKTQRNKKLGAFVGQFINKSHNWFNIRTVHY
jgi:hypothetical protein